MVAAAFWQFENCKKIATDFDSPGDSNTLFLGFHSPAPFHQRLNQKLQACTEKRYKFFF